jgi:hypothetical protein
VAVRVRDSLLREKLWLTTNEVIERLAQCDDFQLDESGVAALRDQRRLFAVRVQAEHLHSTRQFRFGGGLHPRLPELLQLLPLTDGGWAATFWWWQPNYHLRAAAPAECWQSNCDFVIESALKDFPQPE